MQVCVHARTRTHACMHARTHMRTHTHTACAYTRSHTHWGYIGRRRKKVFVVFGICAHNYTNINETGWFCSGQRKKGGQKKKQILHCEYTEVYETTSEQVADVSLHCAGSVKGL